MSLRDRFIPRPTEFRSEFPGADDELVVSPMRRSHIDDIMSIETAVYPKPWTPGVFADELREMARGTRHYIVAHIGRILVGYAGMIYMQDGAHVTNIAVHPMQRRRGIATELLLDLAWEARRVGADAMTLEVRDSNQSAQGLYRRFGFVPVGVRPKYYENRDDAIVMWCHDLQSEGVARRLRDIEDTRPQ
jgi:ribosomal-protein-alanine N-acetyltransferase